MRLVAALGGNALLRAGEKGTAAEQYVNIRLAAGQLAELAHEHDLVITHGNGPQVGKILLQNEAAAGLTPPMPLDICGAMSQGQVGYMLQQQLCAALNCIDVRKDVATVITRVVVDESDPSFQHPAKPIGSFHSRQEAERSMRERKEVWVEDSGRGWRKVVASPFPRRIVEEKVIKSLVENSFLVIAAGGGGIPVVQTPGGYRGVEAVIDKDLSGELLAEIVGADVLLLLTDVPHVFINFGGPGQKHLEEVTVDELLAYEKKGHFAAGSMGPKVRAAIRFVSSGEGRRAIITSLENAVGALHGARGTRVTTRGRIGTPAR
jgi:carbamate kinase